jgi:hypothetical protein
MPVSDPQLKAKIQDFIAEHRRKRREAKLAASGSQEQPMDTTA